MKFTEQEILMYKLMKSIYNSGIPMSFKGSMVLKAYLYEAGYFEDIRRTVDIDANYLSEQEITTQQICESLQRVADKDNLNLEFRIFRTFGDKKSAGFEIINKKTNRITFSMDVDVNRPIIGTKLYEIDNIKFEGVIPLQMICDKICSVSSEKVFRRFKDVVDLFYISKITNINKEEILINIKKNNRKVDNFASFINRKEDLEHAYQKFIFGDDVNRPSFEEIYETVKEYLSCFLNN